MRWVYHYIIYIYIYIYYFLSVCIYILHSKHTWKEETVDNSNCVADMVRASSSMAAQCTAVKPSRSSGNLQDGGMGQAWSKWKPTNSTIRNKPSMMSSKYIQTWDKIWINQLLKKTEKKLWTSLNHPFWCWNPSSLAAVFEPERTSDGNSCQCLARLSVYHQLNHGAVVGCWRFTYRFTASKTLDLICVSHNMYIYIYIYICTVYIYMYIVYPIFVSVCVKDNHCQLILLKSELPVHELAVKTGYVKTALLFKFRPNPPFCLEKIWKVRLYPIKSVIFIHIYMCVFIFICIYIYIYIYTYIEQFVWRKHEKFIYIQ